MNEILAHIYGTLGFELEKTASAEDIPNNLEELAISIVIEGLGQDGNDLEKVASAHTEVYERLLDVDRAGRAIAHRDYSQLEKLAFVDGNPEPLEQFLFGDSQSDTESVKRAIVEEARRRLSV